jgi:hypothetical protein
MITVRRRRSRTGENVYQIWPNDLPDNLPVPQWLPTAGHAPAFQAAIAVARARGDFKPLPYDDEVEEAELSQADIDDFFALESDEGESNDCDYPDWGSY